MNGYGLPLKRFSAAWYRHQAGIAWVKGADALALELETEAARREKGSRYTNAPRYTRRMVLDPLTK